MKTNILISIATKTILLVFIIIALIYHRDANRRSAAQNWDSQLSTEDDGIYTAKYTYLKSDIMLIRLYKTGGKTLLAERTFDHSDMPRVFWTKDKLIYSTNDSSMFYDGAINLPPSWIDKVLAQLP